MVRAIVFVSIRTWNMYNTRVVSCFTCVHGYAHKHGYIN